MRQLLVGLILSSLASTAVAQPLRVDQGGLPESSGALSSSSPDHSKSETEVVWTTIRQQYCEAAIPKAFDVEWVAWLIGLAPGGFATSLRLFTMRWRSFYLTPLQGTVMYGAILEGVHGGLVAGVPFPIDERTEVRAGLGLSGGMVFVDSESFPAWLWGPLLNPEISLHIHRRGVDWTLGISALVTFPGLYMGGSPVLPSIMTGLVF